MYVPPPTIPLIAVGLYLVAVAALLFVVWYMVREGRRKRRRGAKKREGRE